MEKIPNTNLREALDELGRKAFGEQAVGPVKEIGVNRDEIDTPPPPTQRPTMTPKTDRVLKRYSDADLVSRRFSPPPEQED